MRPEVEHGELICDKILAIRMMSPGPLFAKAYDHQHTFYLDQNGLYQFMYAILNVRKSR